MAKYRAQKLSFYNPTNTTIGDGAYVFDALSFIPFDTVYTTVSSGAVSKNTVQTRLWLPLNCVVVASVFGCGAYTASTGTTKDDSYNIVVGEGSSYTAITAGQTAVSAGNELFATNPSLLAQTSPFGLVSYPDVPEAFFPRGTELTLRVVVSGNSSNGTVQYVKVTLAVAPYDKYFGVTGAVPGTSV